MDSVAYQDLRANIQKMNEYILMAMRHNDMNYVRRAFVLFYEKIKDTNTQLTFAQQHQEITLFDGDTVPLHLFYPMTAALFAQVLNKQ